MNLKCAGVTLLHLMQLGTKQVSSLSCQRASTPIWPCQSRNTASLNHWLFWGSLANVCCPGQGAVPKSSCQPGKAGTVGVWWVQTLLMLLGQGPGLAQGSLLSMEMVERAGKGKHCDNGVLGGAGGGRAFSCMMLRERCEQRHETLRAQLLTQNNLSDRFEAKINK